MEPEWKSKFETLMKRASEASAADDAMKFSQAACNMANAMCAFVSAQNIKKA